MVIFHDNHKDENRAEKCNVNLFVLLLCALYATPSFETTLRLLRQMRVIGLCAAFHNVVLENKPRTEALERNKGEY